MTTEMNIPVSDSFVIPDSKQLIIIDAHDTFLKRDFSRTLDDLFSSPREKQKIVWILRDGVLNFLEYFHSIKGMKIVISSDGEEGTLEEHCRRFGIFRYISRIYGIRHIDKYNYVKRLDQILKDLQVEAQETVFIGDGKIDQVSCKKYDIDFIEVPNTLDKRNFSFNSFLHLDFSHDKFGLELQKLSNLRKVHYNLHTPELVEEAIRNEEGKLARLGALVIQTRKIGRNADFDQYIVKEPSTEVLIDWSGKFRPFDIERFHLLYIRLLAFLQGREIYILDCFADADPVTRIPLRVLTQTAWHNLLIRTMFIKATEENMVNFFPEYTIIHVPFFKAVPEFDGMESEDFVLINLLQKVVIIGGTPFTEQIRNAVFTLLSYKLPQEDIIPIRCASNKGKNEGKDLALFFGETDYRKSHITMDPKRNFLGDGYHGWSHDAVINIEWGCRIPIYHMKRQDNQPAFEATRKFATLLVNAALDENRKLDYFSPQTSFYATASFPITHLENADRSGVSEVPKNVFIFQSDALGIFPTLAALSREQAIYYLLMGYGSHRKKTATGLQVSVNFQPLFFGNFFIFPPTRYVMLLWERMERSQTKCWLVNSHHIGDLNNQPKFLNRMLLSRLIHGVYEEVYKDDDMCKDTVWGFHTVSRAEGIDGNHLDPQLAWEDQALFQQRRTQLLAQFKKHFEPFATQLSKPILDAVPH